MRLIPYLIYLLIIALHQVLLKDITTIAGVSIQVTALMVVLVAMYKPEGVVLWFGFFAGMVMVAGYQDLLGWYALLTMGLGLIAFQVCEKLNLESIKSRVLVVLGGVLLHSLIVQLIESTDGYFMNCITEAIPGALYTTVVAWLFFLVKDGHLTFRRIKSLF